MRTCVSLGLLLLSVSPVWSQIGSIPYETPSTPSDDSRMLTPPPVSGEAYPTTVGSQARSNYLTAGLILVGSYDNNVIVGNANVPISDGVYSISPTIELNQDTPRHQVTLQYSPGFTFYQNSSDLNAVTQNVAFNMQYRLTQHMTVSLSDYFVKSSNVFDQLNPLSGGGPSIPIQSPQTVTAPYADELTNVANAVLSYQFSRNGMIGAGGTFTETNYLNSTQASGLSNSNSQGGSVFYNYRLSSAQYTGVTYQYSIGQSNPVTSQPNLASNQAEVHTQTVSAFYTIYLNPSMSLTLSGGPQYFDATQSPLPRVTSWTPFINAAVGWRRSHTNFVANYSRGVTGTTGLGGIFDSTSVNASASWQMSRTWIATVQTNYTINKNATPSFSSSDPGGHSLSGTFAVQHGLGERLTAELGYVHLHQSYNGISLISEAPDSDRAYISVYYHLTRPLGR